MCADILRAVRIRYSKMGRYGIGFYVFLGVSWLVLFLSFSFSFPTRTCSRSFTPPSPYCHGRYKYIGGCSHACIAQPPTWLTPLEILYPTELWIRICCFMAVFLNPPSPFHLFPPRGIEARLVYAEVVVLEHAERRH